MAFFLRFYAGYTVKDIMDQYAIWFFVMLEQAYRLQAEEQMQAIQATSVPHMKDTDRRKYLSELERASHDIIDLGKVNDDYSELENLKGHFK